MKDYITKQDRKTMAYQLTFKEKLAYWWKWKGKDLASLLAFVILVLLLAFVLPD